MTGADGSALDEASALSIRAAATEEPDAIAIVTRDRAITFAEAARAAAGVRLPDIPGSGSGAESGSWSGQIFARPLLAERVVDTVLTVYAALEARVPLGLIHPQQPERVRAHCSAALAAHPVPVDTAVVLFTSGSTGTPRGVILPRRALFAAAAAHAAHLPWRGDDRWLVALPLGHSGGLAAVIRCLAARRPIVLVEQDTRRELPPWPLARALADGAATLTSFVPTQLTALLDEAAAVPPALRAILVGGAATAPSLRRRALAAGWPILVTYGMTETFGQVATALAPSSELDDATDDAAVGPALPGVTVRAGTREAPAPVEILGPVCMTGYLGAPPLPSPRIVTNDDGFLDERGHLHVLGRRDDVIITGGENVSPLVVEEELRQTPHVRDACVFGVDDPRWGQLIAAALVVDASFSLDEAIVCWGALPRSHRPRLLALTDRLPVGATGKVDRRAAAALPDRLAVSYP